MRHNLIKIHIKVNSDNNSDNLCKFINGGAKISRFFFLAFCLLMFVKDLSWHKYVDVPSM